MADTGTLARAVSGHGASVKLVLAGTTTHAAGEVEGVARLRRVVVLDASSWLVRTCRWLPGGPQRFPRQRPNDREEPPRVLH